MNDWVQLEGLMIAASVGVYDWERLAPRPLILDIKLGIDLHAAGASDALGDTIDYQSVADTAAQVGRTRHYALVEAYADALARALFVRFACAALSLTVHKPGAVAHTRSLAVHIERERADYRIEAAPVRDSVPALSR